MSIKIVKKVTYIVTINGVDQTVTESELRDKIADAKSKMADLQKFVTDAERELGGVHKEEKTAIVSEPRPEDIQKIISHLDADPKSTSKIIEMSGLKEGKARYVLDYLANKNRIVKIRNRFGYSFFIRQPMIILPKPDEEKVLKIEDAPDLSALADSKRKMETLRRDS